MFSDAIFLICGVVMVGASLAVLHISRAGELSLRSIAGMLVGAAGAWYVVRALMGPGPTPGELLLPLGVAIWIAGIAWRRRGHPMRRKGDWVDRRRSVSLPVVHQSPWLPPKR